LYRTGVSLIYIEMICLRPKLDGPNREPVLLLSGLNSKTLLFLQR